MKHHLATMALLALTALAIEATGDDGGTFNHHRSIPSADRASIETPTQRRAAVSAHVLRHNPARCGCPEYELLLQESWIRISLEEQPLKDGGAMTMLDEQVENDLHDDRLAHYLVQGEILPARNLCPGGHQHPLLRLDQLLGTIAPTPKTITQSVSMDAD